MAATKHENTSALLEHDQEHSTRILSFQCVGNIRGHSDNRSRVGSYRRAANRQGQGTVEDEHERVKRRGVLGEALPLIESKERHAAARSLSKNSARDALGRRCDE